MKSSFLHALVILCCLMVPIPGLPGPILEEPEGFTQKLVEAARDRTSHFVIYNGKYRKIDYPGGDVPKYLGVCTDVVIRSYRALGVDLQVLVHEDMKAHFSKYPDNWGAKAPDTNIDHRRVPNLEVFFGRKGIALPISENPEDYKPGDLVTWTVSSGRPHIGIVVDKKSRDGERYQVAHNIGWGPRIEDMLFDYPIRGHYRFYGLDSPQGTEALDPD